MTRPNVAAGIDAGSSAIKVAIVCSVGGADGAVLATSVQRIRRRNVRDVARSAFDEACARAQVDPPPATPTRWTSAPGTSTE
jgi:hypothetical protein